MAMFKDDHGGTRPPKQSSAPQNTAVGGGSRPTTSKIGIETSAPMNPHTRGAAMSNYLK